MRRDNRGSSKSPHWWSATWLRNLARHWPKVTFDAGRRMMRDDKVGNLRATSGRITATVASGIADGLRCRLSFSVWSPEVRERFLAVLVSNHCHLADLLAGNFPEALLPVCDAEATPVFPLFEGKPEAVCRCGAEDGYCAHTAAAVHEFARQMETAPLLLLSLRDCGEGDIVRAFFPDWSDDEILETPQPAEFGKPGRLAHLGQNKCSGKSLSRSSFL